MNQDKRQQGTDFGKHQDQSAGNKGSRPGERSTSDNNQQSGQEPGGGRQQGGQRERDESGRGGQQR